MLPSYWYLLRWLNPAYYTCVPYLFLHSLDTNQHFAGETKKPETTILAKTSCKLFHLFGLYSLDSLAMILRVLFYASKLSLGYLSLAPVASTTIKPYSLLDRANQEIINIGVNMESTLSQYHSLSAFIIFNNTNNESQLKQYEMTLHELIMLSACSLLTSCIWSALH